MQTLRREMETDKGEGSVVVHVEVRLKTAGFKAQLQPHLEEMVSRLDGVTSGQVVTQFEEGQLRDNLEEVSFHFDGEEEEVRPAHCLVAYHVYRLDDSGPELEEMDEEGGLAAATHWVLPSKELKDLWSTLIYDTDVKGKLIRYMETCLLFAEKKVNQDIVSNNQLVLLYGPPGTGKTSLCKALAQKLTIRLGHKYAYGQLIEINSHSLFSKWFSESGKLVMKMFQKIQEIIDDPSALVFVLIDEVESLTRSRQASLGNNEPADSVRVVNALLTQLDQIKRYPNVLLLTTSNLSDCLDAAFVDRADIKQFIGLPSLGAVFEIYKSCLEELMERGVVQPKERLWRLGHLQKVQFEESEDTRNSLALLQIAELSVGQSARLLRKIPFLAHANHVSCSTDTSLLFFLKAVEKVVRAPREDNASM